MMIWFLFAVLTVAAALAILAPLARRSNAAEEEGQGRENGPDVAIYKDQLTEIDRDLDRGVIEPEDAEAARAEISRRLLKAARSDRDDAATRPRSGSGRARIAAALAIVGVPLVSVPLYLALGSPSMPDAPLAARLMPSDDGFHQFKDLVAKVEERLARNPGDGRGWDVIAPAYMRMGRAGDAAKAYANAIRLLGENAPRRANQGEAIVAANDGVVTAEAREAFERAVKLAPGMVKPRFYLALGLGQEGKKDEAISAWQTLLKDAQGNEAWVPMAQAELRELGVATPDAAPVRAPGVASAPGMSAGTGNGAGASGMPGPSAADVRAAGEMSAQDRQAMIRGMVSQLDERLKAEGGSVDEWVRLVRALAVLGERDQAIDAVKRARAGLAGDQQGLTTIDALATQLGLES
ncbi:cytochrome c-type biogenesis protein CcmH [Breoghania corrubedonensis]|uniref:Cytochrome c-type biogenesis protein CcmH n=1 Tax=Breoghania corrubedonensis TaxID=665038 RepID=A0A2T5V1M7_9HYPH|nr:c-type cytochrome biogenesis protein CcmI [Breoghania corrubedonensis]PTW57636.1 cytochrome c-type biogenesis protein CcmH [Breoghania corrubedonensis]